MHLLRNKIFRLLLLNLSFIASCTQGQKQDRNSVISEINKDYLKAKSFFKEAYTTHFPETLDSTYITFTDCFSPEVGELRLILTNKIIKEINFDNFIDKAKKAYNPTDSCLLIVNRFATKDDFYNLKLTKERYKLIDLDCYDYQLPIPNFWDNKFSIDQTPCKLTKDFTIYVLDAKNGKYANDTLLTDGRFMPIKWKNGISRGVAINSKEKIIIYWLIIW